MVIIVIGGALLSVVDAMGEVFVFESTTSMHVTNVGSWKQRARNADCGAGWPVFALRLLQSTQTKEVGSAVVLFEGNKP